MVPVFTKGCVMLVFPAGTVSRPAFWKGTMIVPGPETLPDVLFNSPLPPTVEEFRLTVPKLVSVLPLRRSWLPDASVIVPLLVMPAVPEEMTRIPPLVAIWTLLMMPTPLLSAP